MIREAILSDPDLGRILDRDLARRHGVSRGYVQQIRTGRAHSRENADPRLDRDAHPLARAAIAATDLQRRIMLDAELGVLPDATLAERYGCSHQIVWRCRRRAGLEAATQRSRPIMRQRKLEAWLRERPRAADEAIARYAADDLRPCTMQRDMAAIGATYSQRLGLWRLA